MLHPVRQVICLVKKPSPDQVDATWRSRRPTRQDEVNEPNSVDSMEYVTNGDSFER